MFSQGSAPNFERTENKKNLQNRLNCLKGGFYFTSAPILYVEKKYCNYDKNSMLSISRSPYPKQVINMW